MLHQTIIIVDEEKPVQNVLEFVLRRAGYHTLVANDGLEGMMMILKHHPSLVILDDDMPLLRGRDICRNLKSDPNLRTIPVIMHSAYVTSEARLQKEYACADALMPKPTVPRRMLETVRDLLDSTAN